MRHAPVAALAMLACVFLPVVLAVFFVTRNPPLSQVVLRARIEALEEENERLFRGSE